MLAEDVEFARQLRRGEEVARVGVLRDEAERLLFAHASDQDRRMRTAETLRDVQRPLQLIMLARKRFLAAPLAFPHRQADLQRLLEPLEALRDRRERDTEPFALGFVP